MFDPVMIALFEQRHGEGSFAKYIITLIAIAFVLSSILFVVTK